jgi:hypothetical protein
VDFVDEETISGRFSAVSIDKQGVADLRIKPHSSTVLLSGSSSALRAAPCS